MTTTAQAVSKSYNVSVPLALCISGNLVLRIATNATGVMLYLFLRRISDTPPELGGYPISATLVGFFAVTFYVAELVFAPVFGALSDRYGRRLFVILGAVFGAVAVVLTGLTNILAVLLFTRFLEGLSTASSVPAVLGMLSAETADDEVTRGRTMAIFEVATVIGIATGSAVGGRLWDVVGVSAFFIVALIYLVSLLLFSLIRGTHASRNEHANISIRRHLEVLSNPKVLHFAPAWLAINAVAGIWFAHGAFQLSSKGNSSGQWLASGFSGTTIGLVILAYGLAFMLGCLIWGFLYARFTRPAAMLWSLAGTFLSTAALYFLNHFGQLGAGIVAPTLVVVLVAVLVQSGFTPAALGYLSEIAEEYAEDRGTVMGFYSIFLGGGQLVGSAIGGPFADRFGIDGLIYATVLMGVIATVSVLFLRKEMNRVHLATTHPAH